MKNISLLLIMVLLTSCNAYQSIARQIHNHIGQNDEALVCEDDHEINGEKKCYYLIAKHKVFNKSQPKSEPVKTKAKTDVVKQNVANKDIKKEKNFKKHKQTLEEVCKANGFVAKK